MKTKTYLIFRNDNYDEWEKYALESGEYEPDEVNYETYADECCINFGDEKSNLDVDVNGVIVAFGDLGLWHGRVNASKVIGTNVHDILNCTCGDYIHFYCDRWNTYCTDIHHDGRNHYLFRVAKDRDEAERIAHKVGYEGMTREQFMRATKSLRPYIADVYGFK